MRAHQREMPLVAADANYAGEVAQRWRYADGSGEIGVITSVTQPFCGDCTRARLSADGKLYTCLFATHGTDLRARLRDGAATTSSRRSSATSGSRATTATPSCARRTRIPLEKVEMSYIGG